MTHQQLTAHWWAWQKTNKTLRFGQYVMNNSDLPSPNPALFYDTDPKRAFSVATLLCEDVDTDKTGVPLG